MPPADRDEADELIVGQINFGLAYAREARCAYEVGNFDYGVVARKIAVNAYAAAIRFSAKLLCEPKPALIRQIEQLKAELDRVIQASLARSAVQVSSPDHLGSTHSNSPTNTASSQFHVISFAAGTPPPRLLRVNDQQSFSFL